MAQIQCDKCMRTKRRLLSVRLAMTISAGLPLWAGGADVRPTVLVKWKDGPHSAAAATGNAQIGATAKRSFHAIGWQLVELPPGMSVSEGLKAYKALESVGVVEPN